MITIAIITSAICLSQTKPAAANNDLDFWVGQWDITMKYRKNPTDKDWSIAKVKNHITKEMNGLVIHEHFAAPGWNGESVSVYNPQKKIWQQTWVDDQGSYMLFEGKKEGSEVILYTQGLTGRQSRMRFHDIKKDSFIWDWEGSKDGKTWNMNLHFEYKRAK